MSEKYFFGSIALLASIALAASVPFLVFLLIYHLAKAIFRRPATPDSLKKLPSLPLQPQLKVREEGEKGSCGSEIEMGYAILNRGNKTGKNDLILCFSSIPFQLHQQCGLIGYICNVVLSRTRPS